MNGIIGPVGETVRRRTGHCRAVHFGTMLMAAVRGSSVRRAAGSAVLILAVGSLGGCETSLAVAQSGPAAAGQAQSMASALDVLNNATGKYCPGLWCGIDGYQIGAIQLADHGQTLVFVHTDGSHGDTLPVRSLDPRGGTIMGMGAVHFTGDFAPNLVTTEVEAGRLVAALNTIKQAQGMVSDAPPGTAHAQPAGVPSTQTAAAPAAPTPSAAAAVAAPAPQIPEPAAPAATVGTAAPNVQDNRIAISVVDGCHTTEIADDNCDYDNGDNRTSFANDLAQSLTTKGFAVVPADQNASRTLTVTVTGIGDNDADPTGLLCGLLCDATADATASANWQVTDAGGMAGPGGTASSTADDTEPGLQKLADKIAAAVAAQSAAPVPGAAGGSVPAASQPSDSSK